MSTHFSKTIFANKLDETELKWVSGGTPVSGDVVIATTLNAKTNTQASTVGGI